MSPLMLKPIIRPSSQWKKAVPLSVIAHGSYRGIEGVEEGGRQILLAALQVGDDYLEQPVVRGVLIRNADKARRITPVGGDDGSHGVIPENVVSCRYERVARLRDADGLRHLSRRHGDFALPFGARRIVVRRQYDTLLRLFRYPYPACRRFRTPRARIGGDGYPYRNGIGALERAGNHVYLDVMDLFGGLRAAGCSYEEQKAAERFCSTCLFFIRLFG